MLTFHDFLDLHLEGDDLSDCGFIGVVKVAFDAVDGEAPICDCSHIIILQVYHLVCMLNNGTTNINQTHHSSAVHSECFVSFVNIK